MYLNHIFFHTMLRILFAFLGLANGAVLETKQTHFREDWVVKAPAAGWETHEVTFAVKQQNLDKLHDILMEVSTPGSPKRGKYLSYDEVHSLTANKKASRAVLEWLAESGVRVKKIHKHGHYIKAETNVETWQKLLGTKFAHMQSVDEPTNVILRAVSDVHVANELADSITGIFMTTQLPPRPRPRAEPRFIRELGSNATVNGAVTPAGLQSFYHVSGTGSKSVSQAVFESLGQYTSLSDLASFEQEFNIASEGIATDFGGHESNTMCSQNPNNCAEANLDVQYMIGISPVTPETYWYESNQNTPFESWIEAVAEASNPPLVNSISYGSIEPEVATSVATTFNNEAMKLGAQGVSVFVSSGDDGVANFQARGNPSACAYTPSFPASSPYVTAVGATQGGVTGGPEIVCSEKTGGVITTGGGFSTKFDAPSYQKAAISSYFSTVSPKPVAGYATGGRGYPDVAMAGNNYEVVIAGSVYSVSGTSASSPVTAAMASLVNAKLKSNGGSSIGFINPTLYKAGSSSFNRITSGNNKCTASSTCCSQGFYAASGWDPVTGLGSVDYTKLESLFVSQDSAVIV
jgi:tripeptidyl-peptidase-1